MTDCPDPCPYCGYSPRSARRRMNVPETLWVIVHDDGATSSWPSTRSREVAEARRIQQGMSTSVVVRYDVSEFAAVQPPAPAVAVPAPCLDVTGAGGNSETPVVSSC